jgi:spore germination protein GerM
VRRLLALLERGPSERDDGLRSAVPPEGPLRVERDDGVVVVELPEVTGPDQLLAVGQLVLTFTSLAGVEQVRLERDGELVEVPLPDGSLVRRPLTAEDYESLVGASSGTNR